MTISQTADYALRAVIQLALSPRHAQTTQQLSAATQVPQSYLPKVLQPLTRAGVISARRGSRGGYKLQQNPDFLSVLDVINCVDPPRPIERCSRRADAHDASLCALHRFLDENLAATTQRFEAITISELLKQSDDVKPLCGQMAPSKLSNTRPIEETAGMMEINSTG